MEPCLFGELAIDVPIADDHPRAPRQQRFSGRIPDATRGTGDDDGLTPDVVHVDGLYRCQKWLVIHSRRFIHNVGA